MEGRGSRCWGRCCGVEVVVVMTCGRQIGGVGGGGGGGGWGCGVRGCGVFWGWFCEGDWAGEGLVWVCAWGWIGGVVEAWVGVVEERMLSWGCVVEAWGWAWGWRGW